MQTLFILFDYFKIKAAGKRNEVKRSPKKETSKFELSDVLDDEKCEKYMQRSFD